MENTGIKNVARNPISDYIQDMMNQTSTHTGARRLQGLLLLATVPAMLAGTGCRSQQQRIEHYLGARTDRPEAVRQALRDGGRLVPGMTQEEVRLILGPPARTETGPAETGAIWYYDQPKRRDDTLQRSDLWELPVPLQTIAFGPGNTVAEIISYDEDKTIDPPEPSPASASQPPAPRPVPPAPAYAAAMPSYRPEPAEINVYGWPAITLQGLTGSGNARSAAINGRVHEPGDRIGEVRLDAVYANGVVLEYQGQRAFLRPGESTGNRSDGK